MKTFIKNLQVPDIEADIELIRARHCNDAIECVIDKNCKSCLYCSDNINEFREWILLKKGDLSKRNDLLIDFCNYFMIAVSTGELPVEFTSKQAVEFYIKDNKL